MPFRITLACGQGFDVAAPGRVAEGQTPLIYCFPKSHRHAILRLNQLASVETLQAGKGRARGRGRGK